MNKAVPFDWFAEARSQDVQTQLRLINRLREGVPFRELARLIKEIGMSLDEAGGALHIPPRTLARRKETDGRLAHGEGERVVRFAKVLSISKDVLGDLDTAKTWLKQENRALGGVSPLSLLDTDIGTQAVVDVLGRIEHGIFS